MEFDLNDDERALREEARRFLEREAPVAHARAAMEGRPSKDVWSSLAELGWLGFALPEEFGGVGQGFVALSLLVEEMGRVVLPEPYLPDVIAGLAVAATASDEQKRALLPGICDGSLKATLAEAMRLKTDGATLTGEARYVLNGDSADTIVVAAGDGLFVVRRSDVASTTPAGWMDQTRPAFHLRFEAAPAERLGSTTIADVHDAGDRAMVLLAAEMLGMASRITELAVEYAKDRVQFGRPIGAFQAVKHRCADMLADVEAIRNVVWYAAWAIERGHPDAPLAASTAKAVASDAARRVANNGIQVHGGIGFTWENDMHLFFKRIQCSAKLFGDATSHRDWLAKQIAKRYATT